MNENWHSYKVSYITDGGVFDTIIGAKNAKEARAKAFNQRRQIVGDMKVAKTSVVRVYKGDSDPNPMANRVVGAKNRVKHVVEKIGASQINQTRRRLEEELKAQRAWMLLAKDSATSKKARDKAARELAANKRELKAIGGRGPSSKKKR